MNGLFKKPKGYPYELEKNLIKSIWKEDITTINGLMDQYLNALEYIYSQDFDTLSMKVFELCILLEREMQEYIDSVEIDFCQYARFRLDSIETMEGIREFLRVYIDQFLSFKEDFRLIGILKILNKAKEYIDDNIDCNICLDMVSSHVGVSSFYLSRLFSRYAGISFSEYITRQKIEKAKRLLRNTDDSIGVIVEMVGYSSQAYFGQVFKKITGCSAGQYRKTHS